jgi:hypothetical protein
MHHCCKGLWAVLHRGIDTRRELPVVDLAASAYGLHGAVLGNFEFECGQVKDLARLTKKGIVQFALARLALIGKRSTNHRLVKGGQILHACTISTQMEKCKCKIARNTGRNT